MCACGLPDHGTPGGCEAEDEESSHDNQSCACRFSLLRVLLVQRKVTNGCKDEEHHEHPGRSDNQRLATAVVFNNI